MQTKLHASRRVGDGGQKGATVWALLSDSTQRSRLTNSRQRTARTNSIPIGWDRRQMEATVSNPTEVIRPAESVPTIPVPGSIASASDDLPVTVIERKPGWRFLDLGELWRFRELLFFLVWRDVKVRYKQTVLGAAWAVLQPLANMVVFSLIFARLT